MPYADLHSHVLPGIDDGAVDLAETIAMLRRAWRGGTRTVVATPHLYSPYFDDVTVERIFDTYQQTLAELLQRSVLPDCEFLADIDLLIGAENHLTPELLKAADSGDALTLAGTRHLLVELSPFLAGDVVENALDRLLAAGYWPVLAHVERHEDFLRRPQSLARLVEKGCIAQLNAGSVLGSEGREGRRGAFALLSRGLVDVIASDGHGEEHRQLDLSRAAKILTSEFHPTAVRSWFEQTPAEILGNLPEGR